MTANKLGVLPVAGTCPKCGTHMGTTAPKGRVTWRGPCGKCGALVIARRTRPADAAEAAATTKGDQTKRRKRKAVPRVDYDDTGRTADTGSDSSSGRRPESGPDRPADDEDPRVRPGPRGAGDRDDRDGDDPNEHTGGDQPAGADDRDAAEGTGDEPGTGPRSRRDLRRARRHRRRVARVRHGEAGLKRAPYEFLGW